MSMIVEGYYSYDRDVQVIMQVYSSQVIFRYYQGCPWVSGLWLDLVMIE